MYAPTTKFIFHQMGPLVMERRKHWRGKCDHYYFIPYYLNKKYRREDTAVLQKSLHYWLCLYAPHRRHKTTHIVSANTEHTMLLVFGEDTLYVQQYRI